MTQIFPVDHTAADLRQRAAELSDRILKYDHRSGNGEDLIKDSVLFNVTYIELQNRAAGRATGQMVVLTWVSAFVAAASLAVAWLSYNATRSGDEWQSRQLDLLKTIAAQTKAAPPDLRSFEHAPTPAPIAPRTFPPALATSAISANRTQASVPTSSAK